MGMDVYGRKPTDGTGEYFRRNGWRWHPLAEYTQKAAPEIAAHCKDWHNNGGDGLDGPQSVALSEQLLQEVESGRAEKYVVGRQAYLDALPRKECWLCEGTGIRTDEIGRKGGLHEKIITEEGHPREGQIGWCNGCNGMGDVPDDQTYYHLDLRSIQEWVTFLRHCGGFRIW